jgi:PKD repeat protein
MRKLATILCLAASIGAGGCTTKKTEAPPLAGPSGLALSLGLQAVPDSILQDGASQAVIQVDARDADGRPVRALGVRVQTALVVVDPESGFETARFQDVGTLSAKTAVTGEDGIARVVYTAPPRPAEPVDNFTRVRFYVTPVGNDFQGEQERFVTLRLLTPGVILPPNVAPTAAFSSSGNLQPFSDIVFDASATTDYDDGGVAADGTALPCLAACRYTWDFGDGQSGSGIFVKHQFRAPGTFQVKLTATDPRGASHTIAQPIQIGAATLPTAAFTYSPQSPINTNQTIFFNAEGSRAATGRRLVRYDWNFGNGRTDSGITTTFTYPTTGTYLVTLIVTDDIGEKSNPVTASLSIGLPPVQLSAQLITLPATTSAAPAPLGSAVHFDASGSTGPVRIVEYRFNFGDGSPDVINAQPSWSYVYPRTGIFTARVTVRDAEGRTAFATVPVYVQ